MIFFLLSVMSGKSSEEVLLIVNHVKNKKTDGTMYMMGERVGWMQGSKSSFTYSYLYSDIKGKIRRLLKYFLFTTTYNGV